MKKVVKPKNIMASSNVDDPKVISELVNELDVYLADQFDDNLVMKFSQYVDDDYDGEDIDEIFKRVNAARMQYIFLTAKAIRRGNFI